MAFQPVTGAHGAAGSVAPSEIDAWRDAFAAKFAEAEARGLTPAEALRFCTDALLAPKADGTSLRDLPADVAQQIVAARAKAMQEFLTSWAQSIRKNARADDKANQRRLLLAREMGRIGPAAQRRAGERLRSRISKLPDAMPDATAARPQAPDRAAVGPSLAGAFKPLGGLASVGLRNPVV